MRNSGGIEVRADGKEVFARPVVKAAAPRQRFTRRALGAALVLALALPAPAALASEPSSGYGGTTSTPTVTTPTATTPSPPPITEKEEPAKAKEPEHRTSTSPSKEEAKPEEAKPEESGEANQAHPAKVASAHELPLTGWDVGREVGAGLLLIGTGASILMLQRRRS